MTLNDIAVLCNLHESTVSRAVQGKLLEFNQRYIPLKFFFNAKLESGQSSMAIQQKLKKLIEGENKKKPYSDAELSALMSRRIFRYPGARLLNTAISLPYLQLLSVRFINEVQI